MSSETYSEFKEQTKIQNISMVETHIDNSYVQFHNDGKSLRTISAYFSTIHDYYLASRVFFIS